ncbi:MAG: UDP-N-acetylglucosamine 2-epimerase (non-hydrolyzing) [Euryarchaeota archaeon]|nr:UDP-N-acetylglucosamine 2-epimerase (non-hydrolyzing) [Euryarchaeota archaeon]
MKVVSIVGARPQFIKCVFISQMLKKNHQEVLVHTGQHYDYEMSKLFFDQLGIPKPNYNLGIGSGTHGQQTGNMLIAIEKVLLKEKPDCVLVYGDTNSTLAGALAAVKIHLPVGHVEAGLRNFDKSLPEEINRICADYSSDFLFVPTKTAVENLKREGITKGVYLTGDVMYDVLIHNLKFAEKSKILKTCNVKPKEYFLTTIHRPASTDDPKILSTILDTLSSVDETVVFPVHPRTQKFITKYKLQKKIKDNVLLIKPVGYLDFLWLEKNAKKIMTDSGGIQKEAYILKVPCITLMETTSWVETTAAGWNILAGLDKKKIMEAARHFQPKGRQQNVFGDGHASDKIVKILEKHFT